ncbi:MAG: NUDIX hydrolase [Candidatus Acetothermia bacterium]|nr:NUDIX hydrolase [Candidatus Acetothermia bacterium]MDH7505412.1 NUDIX hydrolase [Candidatus Acetothermia bacterium]
METALGESLGRPEEVALPEPFQMQAEEFRLLRASLADGRSQAQDVTLFILIDGRIVVIRKPFHPPGVWRPPSGLVRESEELLEAARREALEEAGLEVELERYLLRLRPTFVHAGEEVRWTSHVFLARRRGGALRPRDTREIAAVRLVSAAELQGPIRERLIRSGLGGLRYRAELADFALARLRELGVIPLD